MSFFKTIFLALISFFLASVNSYAESATNINSGQMFGFKFELNKPLIYDFFSSSRSVSDFSSGTRSSLTKKTVEIHYKIKLTATDTNQDGTTTVLIEPSDLVENFDIVSASGHITTSVRGLDILVKQNDIVMVDTKNHIGMGQAPSLKYPVYPLLLSGYFYFDQAGNVKDINGDLPFIDTWRDRLKSEVGFFCIVFPTNSISVRDSWTNFFSIKESAGTTYNGNGITRPNVFIRELDSLNNNLPVACFRLYESDNYQDLGAHMEQSGQQTSIVFPERNESINGTFHFDQQLGRLIDLP